jgi:thiamine biosynthesis lipoprotein
MRSRSLALRSRRPALALALFAAACDGHLPPPSAATTPDADANAPPPPSASAAPSEPASSPVPAHAVPRRVSIEGKAMGTHVLLVAFTSDALDEAALRPKLEAALAEIRRVEALMTTWRDDSEVSRINAAAGKEAVKVGPETLEVIEKSLWASRASGGVFDITFEAMHGLWKFDQDLEERIPSPAAVAKARRLIDFRRILVDHDASTVKLATPGMRMSLGGIAKGYGVDAAARVLAAQGLSSYFVQAGGDLYVRGRKPDGSRWRVGARDPRSPDPGDFFAMVEVEDHAFSTAGDYERSFVKDGKRWHHIIDPRTGYPATASRSVTIWAKDALTADAIDDAVFILGPEKGLALVESIDDCGAVVVDAKNEVHVSKRLAGRVRVVHPPTDGI